jgi:hypothetical protein
MRNKAKQKSEMVAKQKESIIEQDRIPKEPEKSLKKIEQPKLESTLIKTWVDEQGNSRIVLDPSLSGIDVLKKTTGTRDTEIAESIMSMGAFAIESIERGGDAKRFSQSFNIIMQSLHDFQPKDAVEARLVTQAVTLYQHGMDRLGRAGRSDRIDLTESQVNMAIKLLRVHNETIEALNRYRRGGEQKVIVQHVTADKAVVNQFNGNQLVVGGGSPEKQGDKPCS